MKRHRIAAIAALGVAATFGMAGPISPVSAHGVAAGKAYGCQINPSAPACQKTTTPATVHGSVSTVPGNSPGASPGSLPPTGGADPMSPAGNLAALLLAGMLSLGGVLLRRRVRS